MRGRRDRHSRRHGRPEQRSAERRVTQPNGTSNSSTHGSSRLTTGYIVGCQVDITGLKGNLGVQLGLPFSVGTEGSLDRAGRGVGLDQCAVEAGQ